MNAGQMKTHCHWIHLIELVNDSLQMTIAYPGRPERQIEILNDLSGIELFVDRQLIRQVLLNILSNAIKFTQAGGHISIRADVMDTGNIDITIADDGIGIPTDKIDYILRPFTQIENMMTKTHQGTGLGLTLSAKIMQLHNGVLKVESIENKGTTIHLIFPSGSLRNSQMSIPDMGG